ncbi:HNH endonuclease signature motif containing protein [Chryseobacterium viscerum]|uniref:HNH endonuclease n=1 Tax=Chryseobacterium viscerum TaxID=1037377 RepID=A0A316WHM1_9FLAO|nr:HNH endonuclease signature motif containing protein [Chryseobacterium viscerum]PWN60874.1 HNH endonuclease [Chryseobacterium viscerum]
MSQKRPKIKPSIKREVRQRCGFGCVICGNPIFEYDHILGWANVKRHVANEITLLCDMHHKEKTTKRLPNFLVIEANKTPYNIRVGKTLSKCLYYYGDSANVVFGSMRFTMKRNDNFNYLIPITFEGVSPIKIRFEDQMCFLNIELQDPLGNIVLKIVDNELVLNIGMWDIEFVGQKLTLRERAYETFIVVIFETPNTINFIKGKVFINGKAFYVHPKNGLQLPGGFLMSNVTITGANGIIDGS